MLSFFDDPSLIMSFNMENRNIYIKEKGQVFTPMFIHVSRRLRGLRARIHYKNSSKKDIEENPSSYYHVKTI